MCVCVCAYSSTSNSTYSFFCAHNQKIHVYLHVHVLYNNKVEADVTVLHMHNIIADEMGVQLNLKSTSVNSTLKCDKQTPHKKVNKWHCMACTLTTRSSGIYQPFHTTTLPQLFVHTQ